MPAIITYLSKFQRSLDFIDKATYSNTADKTLYVGIGKINAWTDENSPDIPDGNEKEIEEIQLIKRINKTDNSNIFLIKNGGKILLTVNDSSNLQVNDIIHGNLSYAYGKILKIEDNNITIETYENHWENGENILKEDNSIATSITNVNENYYKNSFYFRNTAWEKITISDTSPSDPQIYDIWYDTTTKTLKKFDGTNWITENNLIPHHVYIKCLILGTDGKNNITYRQIGVIETPKDSSGNVIYDNIRTSDINSYILHYLNNVKPIQRNSDQNEEINIIIEF